MKVFLSYSFRDARLAEQVRAFLESSGLSVFDAQVDVMPGDNWASVLAQALDQSDAMVVLLTPAALQSQQVHWEIQFALKEARFEGRLIPVMIESPSQLALEQLPWILNRLQIVHWQPGESEALQVVAQRLHAAA